ncbi:MAG: xanthine dehydrogenase accessory protein XdhC [Halocynthiibacter sp.]
MSFDHLTISSLLSAHGALIRVVITRVEGSSPRDVGAALYVWEAGQDTGQDGSIGGGALEFLAAKTAREMLKSGQDNTAITHALGPNLGQCCGGSIELVYEYFDRETIKTAPKEGLFIRHITGTAARAPTQRPAHRISYADGWIAEPVSAPKHPVWIYGAGHIGRALAPMVAGLPDMAVTWVDFDLTRFPKNTPEHIQTTAHSDPSQLVPYAPKNASHVIATYSHALDFDLCHAVLSHGFSHAGLIGSRTKWARFTKRLLTLGHGQSDIARIACPYGDQSLGKHPQAIALAVSIALLNASRDSVRPYLATHSGKDLAS